MPDLVDRLAQPADVNIDRAIIDIDIVTPDAIEQLLTGIDPPRRTHQKFQQAELGRSKVDLAVLAPNAVGFAVEFDIADDLSALVISSGLDRRSSALMRAESSGIENGLTT
jgi:hypothetical protein